MPAKSKAQQQAAGVALAAKRGQIPISRLKGSSLSMYKSMTEEELEDYARNPSVESMSPEEKIRHGLKQPLKKR